MPAFAAPSTVILAQSAVAVSHTGDTNEFTHATITIPAGAMGPNGQVEITTLWTVTNSANNKTLKVRFGGTSYLSAGVTTSATGQVYTRIANRNSAASQVGFTSSAANGFGVSTSAIITSTVDTTADVPVLITGTLANTGETITLESYIVKLFRGA